MIRNELSAALVGLLTGARLVFPYSAYIERPVVRYLRYATLLMVDTHTDPQPRRAASPN